MCFKFSPDVCFIWIVLRLLQQQSTIQSEEKKKIQAHLLNRYADIFHCLYEKLINTILSISHYIKHCLCNCFFYGSYIQSFLILSTFQWNNLIWNWFQIHSDDSFLCSSIISLRGSASFPTLYSFPELQVLFSFSLQVTLTFGRRLQVFWLFFFFFFCTTLFVAYAYCV